MRKVVGVMWHGRYNLLLKTREQLKERIDLCMYSSKLLDCEEQDIDNLYRDLKSADMAIFQISSSNSCWTEIEEFVKQIDIPIIYLGAEGASRIKSKEQLEICSKCNKYMSYSGDENLENMIKYAVNSQLGEKFTYGEPIFLPWEGIFHPDTKEVFQSTEEYFKFKPKSNKGIIALLTSRGYWINEDIEPEIQIIRNIESKGYSVIPIYSYTIKDDELGAKGSAYAVEKFLFDKEGNPIVDGMIKLTSFFLETISSRITNTDKKPHSISLLQRLNCPVIKPVVSSNMTIDEWRLDKDGTTKDIAWSIALPELEGVIEPIFIGGMEREGDFESRVTVQSRIDKLVDRMIMWVKLKNKSNKDKKIVFVLNNNPCASVEATVAGGANLDSLESVASILNVLKEKGYDLENIPSNGKELIDNIMEHKAISEFRWTTIKEIVEKGGVLDFVSKEEYLKWFDEVPEDARDKMIKTWGKPIGEEINDVPVPMVYDNKIMVTGVSFKNAIVCVQPKRGCAGPKCDGVVCKILHDPDCPPTHQYLATYKYFEHKYNADLLIHVGTHGNLEFLPGKGTGLSDSCFPDICAGNLPCLYLYNSDNPPEGTIAKRRGLATIIDHMQTVLTQGGVYDELEELDNLLAKYDKVKLSDETQAHLLEHMIKEEIEKANLDTQINLENYHERFEEIVEQAHSILTLIKNTQIQDGQHIFGEIPEGDKRIEFLNSIVRYEGIEKGSLRSLVCKLIGVSFKELISNKEEICHRYKKNNGSILFDLDQINKNIMRRFLEGKNVDETLDILEYEMVDKTQLDIINDEKDRILDINERLSQSKEMDSLISALNSDYIQAGPAGVVTRGRDDVLPTGRNFFTLDPTTIPTKVAYEVGKRLGDSVIEKYLKEQNSYPEDIAMYWMCNDIMWADGEGMAQLLYLIGAKPKWLSNGKVVGFEIIPLEELKRPRIDITIKISGILRDNFYNCIELVDEAVQEIAKLDEPLELNYIRKHTIENMEKDKELSFEQAASRIFGARPGTYVAGINLAVYASSWKDEKDFLDIFTYYNGYSYGKNKYGKESYRELQNSLKNVDITYNKVISDEHDLLGCCCYFGNHGGMTAAARELSKKEVQTYYGDTREVSNVEIRTLADELRRVVRSRLLNPKWIDGQKDHGYKGAADISKRVGRVYGWEATTQEVDDWIFDDITKTFILNEENREFFMENNPWALEEISRRLIEAYKRELWTPEEGLIEEIQDNYLELEGFMEENMGDDAGEFQGGAIDIVDLNELENYTNNIKRMKDKLYK